MLKRTVPMPGCGLNESKSDAMRLMLIIIPSTGSSVILWDTSFSERLSSTFSIMVMAYPCSRAAERIPSTVAKLPNSRTSYRQSPTELYCPLLRERPAKFGRNPSFAMAACTRNRVSSLTFDNPFATRETVCCETPASRATSAIDIGRLFSSDRLAMCYHLRMLTKP